MFMLWFLNLVDALLNFLYTLIQWSYIGMPDYPYLSCFSNFIILSSFKLQDFVLRSLFLLPFLVNDDLFETIDTEYYFPFLKQAIKRIQRIHYKKQCFTFGYEESIWSNRQRSVRILVLRILCFTLSIHVWIICFFVNDALYYLSFNCLQQERDQQKGA